MCSQYVLNILFDVSWHVVITLEAAKSSVSEQLYTQTTVQCTLALIVEYCTNTTIPK